jgi:hypothetical protein
VRPEICGWYVPAAHSDWLAVLFASVLLFSQHVCADAPCAILKGANGLAMLCQHLMFGSGTCFKLQCALPTPGFQEPAFVTW